MVSRETARTVIGFLGNIIAFFLFLSPVPTFIDIRKKGAVEKYSAVQYLATLMNCGVWFVYGLPMVHPNSTLVSTVNGAGIVIELFYLVLFLIYSDKKKRLRILLIILTELVSIALLAFLVLRLTHSTKLRSTIVGSVGLFGSVLMYVSPIPIMKLVINTKSVEYMPFSISLASFANAVSWMCYALIRFDPFIAAPNLLGTLFGLSQLILYAVFYNSTKRQMAERKATMELHSVEAAIPPPYSEDFKKIGTDTPNGHV